MSIDLGVSAVGRQATPPQAARAPNSPAAPAPQAARAAQEAAAQIPPPKQVQLTVNLEEERRQVQEAVALLNERISSRKMGLGFAVDEKLGRPIVTVRNANSGEVVRQIPNEAAVRMAHSIEEFKGMLHNSQV